MIATTAEQSKRLVELGLDPDTSDMMWKSIMDTRYPYTKSYKLEDERIVYDYEKKHYIPAWSFDALTKVISDAQNFELHLRTDKTWNLYSKYSDDAVFRSFDINNGKGYKSPIDAAYHLLTWLLENGKFKTKKGGK